MQPSKPAITQVLRPSEPSVLEPQQTLKLPNVKPKQKARRELPKKSAKGARKNSFRPLGSASYGVTIPPLHAPDGQPYTCPCGRLQMMRRADGGVFLFDLRGPFANQSVGKPYYGPVLKAVAHFKAQGCKLHEKLPEASETPAQAPPAPHPYWK